MSNGPFNPNETARWWHQLYENYDDEEAEFIRVYFVPGLGHCGGGPVTSQFDLFSVLVKWVEDGVPPHRVLATAPVGTPWPGQSRPLFPYPTYAG